MAAVKARGHNGQAVKRRGTIGGTRNRTTSRVGASGRDKRVNGSPSIGSGRDSNNAVEVRANGPSSSDRGAVERGIAGVGGVHGGIAQSRIRRIGQIIFTDPLHAVACGFLAFVCIEWILQVAANLG